MGKALEDPATGLTALRRVGVSFTETQKQVIKSLADSGEIAKAQSVILDAIAGQVGGASEALAQIATGAREQLKNAWGDLGELVGKKFTESFEKPVRGITKILNALIEKSQKKDLLKDLASGSAEYLNELQQKEELQVLQLKKNEQAEYND